MSGWWLVVGVQGWYASSRLWLVACAAVGVCAYSLLQPSRPDPPLLTVLTWNMHGGRGDLRRLIADLEAGRLTPGAPRDYVLLLQEFVNRDDVPGSTTRALTLFTSPVRSATGNAILSTIPLEASRTIDLPRERQPRGAVAATIRIGGDALFVVSTHLENRLGWLRGLFGDRARGRQADALLQALPQGTALWAAISTRCWARTSPRGVPFRAISGYTGRTRADVSRPARARSSVFRFARWMACDAAGDP